MGNVQHIINMMNTNLISQIGFAAEGYKDLSGVKKTPRQKNLLKMFFNFPIWEKFIYNEFY